VLLINLTKCICCIPFSPYICGKVTHNVVAFLVSVSVSSLTTLYTLRCKLGKSRALFKSICLTSSFRYLFLSGRTFLVTSGLIRNFHLSHPAYWRFLSHIDLLQITSHGNKYFCSSVSITSDTTYSCSNRLLNMQVGTEI
jgi:hypothetical protein